MACSKSVNTLRIEPEILIRFPPRSRYLVGVSGGRDSVALLHRLVELGYRRLIVCHLDHGLRGRASRGDAKFVKALAKTLKLECEVAAVDVTALANKTKESLETTGRTARYKFFARIGSRRRCRTIFLGHHADDLVETFLLNLFRGAGPAGFGGIQRIARRRINKTELTIVRPLLGTSRKEIDAYLKAHRLKYRDDASNETLAPVRNRIRRRIIPYIEKQLGRKVGRALWRAAMISADEADWAEGLIDSQLTQAAELPVRQLRAQSRALQRRTILRWLQNRGISDLDFET